MSLADELLLDLDGDSDGALSDTEQQPQAGPSTSKSTSSTKSSGGGLMLPPSTLPSKRKALEDSLDDANGGGADSDDEMDGGGEEGEGLMAIPEGGVRPADELDKDAVEEMALGGVDDVKKVAKLLGAKRLEDVLRVSELSCLESHSCARIGRSSCMIAATGHRPLLC